MYRVHLDAGTPVEPWRRLAACRLVDTEMFFPRGTTGSAETQIERAKACCSTCSVQVQCLSYAVDTCQDDGVWGGTTEDERRPLRRAARPRADSNLGRAR